MFVSSGKIKQTHGKAMQGEAKLSKTKLSLYSLSLIGSMALIRSAIEFMAFILVWFISLLFFLYIVMRLRVPYCWPKRSKKITSSNDQNRNQSTSFHFFLLLLYILIHWLIANARNVFLCGFDKFTKEFKEENVKRDR